MPPNQQNPYTQPPQQNGSGGYDVVPPLPNIPNAGHSGHNPYEFIVNPAAPRRTSSFSFGGGSAVKRLAVVLVGAIILVVVAVIAVNLLTPKGPMAQLTAIAQRQQEIVRIATAASQNGQGQDTLNFAANTEVVITSAQNGVVGYLGSHGTKLKAKDLALDQSSQTDSLLANSQTNNTYDTAVASNLVQQLSDYQGLVKSTYGTTSSASLKRMLQTDYTAAGLLLAQAKAIQE